MARERATARTRADGPLTASERVFVAEYLVDLNGARAYRAAFPGATPRSARVLACRLLAKVNVWAEVAAAHRARQRRTRLTADKVLRELARVAFADVGDLFDEAGHAREPRDIPLETRRALASVKVSRERTTRRVTRAGRTTTTETVRESVIEYRFADKVAALGRLFDHLGLRTAIPPLEALMAALPTASADELRKALSDAPSGKD